MATAMTGKEVGDYWIDSDVESLGIGSYGQVFLGKQKDTKEQVAAKLSTWEKDLITPEADREAELMKKIPEHDNVVKILDYIKKDIMKKDIRGREKAYVQVWIILELCTLGNLIDFVEETPLRFVQKVDLLLQGARGLQHLHGLTPSIIHHDIKPANILITGICTNPTVKLADFGISKHFAHAQEKSVTKRTREGTDPFLAPELFKLGSDNRSTYNKSIDIFAYGVSSVTLLEAQEKTRMTTFKGKRQINVMITRRKL